MTEVNISARVPKTLDKELEAYMKAEYLERSAAVRRLLFAALEEWRVAYAIKLLEEGKVSVLKAAELGGMDVWTFMEKLRERKVRWVDEEGIKRDLEEFK